MKANLKEPCKECPWRKLALPGYLGADEPNNFWWTSEKLEGDMPCHMTVDYERDDWEKTLNTDNRVSLCAGGLAHMANRCKRPRDKNLAAAVDFVGPRDDVFRDPQDFRDHHLEVRLSAEWLAKFENNPAKVRG